VAISRIPLAIAQTPSSSVFWLRSSRASLESVAGNTEAIIIQAHPMQPYTVAINRKKEKRKRPMIAHRPKVFKEGSQFRN